MTYKSKYYEIVLSNIEKAQFLTTPENVMEALKEENDIQEKMIIFGMNTKNKVIFKKIVAIGNHNTITCSPADIFIPLLKLNARNFIIAHNHPSENVDPSSEDIVFTRKISKGCEYVGLSLLDHIIFNDNDMFSFKKNNLI